MSRPALHFLLVVLAAASLLDFAVPAPARAQLVGTATVETQYRLRGVALTNGKPDVRLGLSYDHASGVYAGLSVIAGETGRDAFRPLGYTGYIGFAKRISHGLDWDVGLTSSRIDINIPGWVTVLASDTTLYTEKRVFHYKVEYSEIYTGLAGRNISAHLYLSPDYLGQGFRTAYLDVTATVRPMEPLRVFAHVGALTPLGGRPGPNSDREHFDLRTGVAWEFRHGDVQLAWTATSPQVQYPIGVYQGRSALILSATGFF